MDFQQSLTYFTEHEGKINHMYVDSVGLVTVGIGRMLPDATAAQALPFVFKGTTQRAGLAEIALSWQTMHDQEKGHAASYYEQFTLLELPDADCDADFWHSVGGFTVTLRQRFPKFDGYPDAVQLGLLDMLYSMSQHELFAGYPHFCAAVDSQDWLVCAQECRRGGVSDQRNTDCAALFSSAAIPS
jgi:hypothetical protein